MSEKSDARVSPQAATYSSLIRIIMKKLNLNFFLLLLVLFVFSTSCKKETQHPKPVSPVVTFGALLPISGPDAEGGKIAQAAVNVAINDLNNFMTYIGSSTRYACVIEDSQSDTNICLEKVKKLNGRGIKLLLGGPYNSRELSAIKSYLDQNQMLMLNVYSTSTKLSIAGDNIFRLAPDDTKQALGIVAMLKYYGVRAFVPLFVNDLYGSGLMQKITSAFLAEGGIVSEGVSYSNATGDYTMVVNSLNEKVSAARQQYGGDKVAVVIVSSTETSAIFDIARTFPDLTSVKWIGCDGNAGLNSLVDNRNAASFAKMVKFLAPIFEVGHVWDGPYTPEYQQIIDEVKSATGMVPNDNCLLNYDAVKIYALTSQALGDYSFDGFKKGLPLICASYSNGNPTSGYKLNDAGDIAEPWFGFWAIIETNGLYKWELTAHCIQDQIEFIVPSK